MTSSWTGTRHPEGLSGTEPRPAAEYSTLHRIFHYIALVLALLAGLLSERRNCSGSSIVTRRKTVR